MNWKQMVRISLGVALGILWPMTLGEKAASQTTSLEGVWEAKRDFGPAVKGMLDIVQANGKWSAQIAQFDVPLMVKGDRISLQLPNEQGWFEGRLEKDRSLIRGHWIQPPTVNSGAKYASPVILKQRDNDRWRGEVLPLKDEFTLYLVLTRRVDGSLGAVIRNPDRNIGINLRLERLERQENRLKLIGKTSAERVANEIVVAEGVYDADQHRMSFYFKRGGGSYDFAPITNNPATGFYARGKETYQYKPPVADHDGWPSGTLEEVGMTAGAIGEMVRYVNAPFRSLEDPYVHGVLVARHGKLVLEEYFYGFHRNKPHDTRSASKSLTATLVGAAILNGAKLDPSMRVYDLLYKGTLLKDLDPRKKEMRVEHLLNMASGYDCDDRVEPPRPGNEDRMWEGENRDFYNHILNLPMDGRRERIAYCSIDPNLLGAVLSTARSSR